MRRTPALIVGGGPAGAAAAITLARAGAPHLLIERTRETGDMLCGGFLSWRTLETLAAIGIDADDLNRQPINRIRLFAGSRHAETRLPRPARGVSRHRLDGLLLDRAAQAGAAIERGIAVRSIEATTARLNDGAEIAADALFLASGKHDVRGAARPASARGDDPAMGLRVRLPPSATLDRLVGDAIELHLFDGGYAGLDRQEDGSGNLCLAVRRSAMRAGGDPLALIRTLGETAPHLGERLVDLPDAPADAVANVPYGWRATRGEPGLFRLGDQAGVIPSLAGEGMGIALASGSDAAAAYLRGGAAAARAWQAGFARATRRPIGIAAFIWHLAERPATARWLIDAAAAFPPAVRGIARLTRLPGTGH
ncbi:FAD-binding monooxygenase [Sphingomonas sp. EC-HK361]|uniref:NAD(P)/FAD-dependent oxidoreductase n=1 Tax=Sphingomonas sp. EC-HK361 TaxID=2038397 RepID=UPI001251046C|nr:FAD-dependent monooxygenase [Sphingomonas sp. EC-HK361]VVT06468.1 FAD-binding monooxygenase [Sphingomonas sp. EC-HK361]